MKSYLLLPMFLGMVISTKAQSTDAVVIGVIDSINSKILEEKRKIWIYVPGQATNETVMHKRFPVVYLLDGDKHFTALVGMISELGITYGNSICPPMIVVGIPNTNRYRDLTPTRITFDDPEEENHSGGGKKFISFIKNELVPYIESKYPTEKYRMLIGHSLGGLMVLDALVHETALFNSYVAIDPSTWWDDQRILQETHNLVSSRTLPGKTLFIGLANTLPDGMDSVSIVKDTSAETHMLRGNIKLHGILNKNYENGLKHKVKYYNDDDHLSVPLISMYDALRFIFEFYQLKLSYNEYFDFNKDVINKIETHYITTSKKMGFLTPPPESLLSFGAYQNLEKKRLEEAEYLLKLHVECYPTNLAALEALGDFYKDSRQFKNAAVYYKNILLIKDSTAIRKKLAEIENIKLP